MWQILLVSVVKKLTSADHKGCVMWYHFSIYFSQVLTLPPSWATLRNFNLNTDKNETCTLKNTYYSRCKPTEATIRKLKILIRMKQYVVIVICCLGNINWDVLLSQQTRTSQPRRLLSYPTPHSSQDFLSSPRYSWANFFE